MRQVRKKDWVILAVSIAIVILIIFAFVMGVLAK